MKRYITILTLTFYCAANYAQNSAGTTLAKIPFKLLNNHIYLNLQINDSKPLWFILDTGAPSIIDLKQAKKLGLELYSSQKATGVGNATDDVSLTGNISFRLKNINHIEKEVAVAALTNVEECANKLIVDIAGNILTQEKKIKRKSQYQPIDGVLGSGFFKSFVVEINYKQQYLVLHDPRSYRYNGNGKIIPIDITANHIFTNASVSISDSADIKGYFMIDTGSMLAITLNTPFIRMHNLLPPSSQTKTLSVCGLGGSSHAQIGTVQKLSLKEISLNQLPALFSQATGGVLTSTEFDGHIGNAVLRQFNVIFDYYNKRMILE